MSESKPATHEGVPELTLPRARIHPDCRADLIRNMTGLNPLGFGEKPPAYHWLGMQIMDDPGTPLGVIQYLNTKGNVVDFKRV